MIVNEMGPKRIRVYPKLSTFKKEKLLKGFYADKGYRQVGLYTLIAAPAILCGFFSDKGQIDFQTDTAVAFQGHADGLIEAFFDVYMGLTGAYDLCCQKKPPADCVF